MLMRQIFLWGGVAAAVIIAVLAAVLGFRSIERSQPLQAAYIKACYERSGAIGDLGIRTLLARVDADYIDETFGRADCECQARGITRHSGTSDLEGLIAWHRKTNGELAELAKRNNLGELGSTEDLSPNVFAPQSTQLRQARDESISGCRNFMSRVTTAYMCRATAMANGIRDCGWMIVW